MQSRWSDQEARRFVERYASSGEDVALRVYTSRLIGSEPALVMHGGGNTSVKSVHRDLFGDSIEAIYVKGSGWNLDSIEPPGLPGLDLEYLRRLRSLPSLSDEEMVNQLRSHLFDAAAPNPSVETLLHAFLPAKFVDHSHADAILAVTNQKRGEEFVREALGDDAAPLIARVTALQDHLGLMNDANVSASMARTFLVEHAGELSGLESAAIGRYLVSREREVARLKRTIGGPWRGVAGIGFRRALGRLVAGR